MEFDIKATVSTKEFKKLIKFDFDSWMKHSTHIRFFRTKETNTKYGVVTTEITQNIEALQLAKIFGNKDDTYQSAKIVKFETGNSSDIIIYLEASSFPETPKIRDWKDIPYSPYTKPFRPFEEPVPQWPGTRFGPVTCDISSYRTHNASV